MKNVIYFLLLPSLFLIVTPSLGQQYKTGLNLDKGSTKGLNIYERDAFGFGEKLPDSISWRQFAPYPGNQGNYGTCVGWSSGYCALTTLYAKKLNIKNRNVITAMAMCPYTVYNNIKEEDDLSCQEGTMLETAGEFLTTKGTKRMHINESDCGTTDALDMKMGIYKADDFSALWEWNSLMAFMSKEEIAKLDKVGKTKSALADGNIVVIGMGVGISFTRDVNSQGVWEKSKILRENNPTGGHAMCVLGYDDNRYGGTFEVQNSWGQDWGAGGYVYISYKDFEEYVRRAIVLELDDKESETSVTNGCLYGDCKESYSRFKFKNGDIYEGMAKTGKANGYGVYQWVDGDVYAGNFVNGLKDGAGIYFYSNGTSQRGYWKNDEFRSDLSYLDYKYSSVEFENYKLMGYTKNKEWIYGACMSKFYRPIYHGKFSSDGDPHDFGLLNYSDESILGIFHEGENHGFTTVYSDNYWGVYHCLNDDCDEVEPKLISKKYENLPVLKEIEKDSVALAKDGCLFGNCQNSFSRLEYSSKSKFEGFLVNGWRHGYGIYTFPEGSEIVSYEGEYSFGKRSGIGRLTMKDGSWFIGEFDEGKISGKGMWVKADGTIQAGFWEADVYIVPDEEFGFSSNESKNIDTKNKGLENSAVEQSPRLFLSPVELK